MFVAGLIVCLVLGFWVVMLIVLFSSFVFIRAWFVAGLVLI